MENCQKNELQFNYKIINKKRKKKITKYGKIT